MHVEGPSLRLSTWNPAAGFIIPVAQQTVLRDETGPKSAVADLRYREKRPDPISCQKRHVRFIPSALSFLDWNEMEGAELTRNVVPWAILDRQNMPR